MHMVYATFMQHLKKTKLHKTKIICYEMHLYIKFESHKLLNLWHPLVYKV